MCGPVKTWASLKTPSLLTYFKKPIKMIKCKEITNSMFQMLLKALNTTAGQGIKWWESSCSFRLKHKSYLALTAEVLVWLILTSSWQKFALYFPCGQLYKQWNQKKWKTYRMVPLCPLEKPNPVSSLPHSLPFVSLLFKKPQLHPVSFQLVMLPWTVSESCQGINHSNSLLLCS